MKKLAAEIVSVADKADVYGMPEYADVLLRAASIVLAAAQDDIETYTKNLAQQSEDEAKLAEEKAETQKQRDQALQRARAEEAKQQAELTRKQNQSVNQISAVSPTPAI